MAYQWNVSLTIPHEHFGKLYAEPFEYKKPVSVERAPFINPDKSSQVSYLRWITEQSNVAQSDEDHILEVVDVFSHLPFDISCVRCGDEKAVKIVIAYQNTYDGFRDVLLSRFPFYCDRCGDYAGARTIEFALNFDDPFTRQPNTRLGRRELLADLKSMLYLGFENGPKEFLDTREIAGRIRDMKKGGRFVMHIDNEKAKELVNMLHFLKKTRGRYKAGGNTFSAKPSNFRPSIYRERPIYMIQKGKRGKTRGIETNKGPLFAKL